MDSSLPAPLHHEFQIGLLIALVEEGLLPLVPALRHVAGHASDDEGGAEAACCDAPEELALVADPDWDCHPPSDDVPWEVTGDAFDASF